MEDYAGRVLADRYRLPLPPSDEYDLVETRAFDGYSGQEVLVRQVPLPEVVDAEFLDHDGGPVHRRPAPGRGGPRRSGDPAVRRAIEAAQAAAQIPDHPRLDQVFDVFEEDGSLWIVSELVAARPLAALLAEAPLSPYRAAEVASDVLTALRVLHAHGWTHRNITVRTVLVCDDGRIVLTGLAAGAAEEALCGYAPIPGAAGGGALLAGETDAGGPQGAAGPPGEGWGDAVVPVPRGHVDRGDGGFGGTGSGPGTGLPALPTDFLGRQDEQPDARQALPPGAPGRHTGPLGPAGPAGTSGQAGPAGAPGPATPPAADARATRAGAIAAYRAGARAAVKATEEQRRQAAAPARGPYLQDPGSGPGAEPGGATGTGTADGPGAGSPYGAAAAGTGPVSPYGEAAGPAGRRPGAVSPYGTGSGTGSGNSGTGGSGGGTEPTRPGAVSPYGRPTRAISPYGEGTGPARSDRGEGTERVGGQTPGTSWHGVLPRGGGAGGEALRADELRHSQPGQAHGQAQGQNQAQGRAQSQGHGQAQGPGHGAGRQPEGRAAGQQVEGRAAGQQAEGRSAGRQLAVPGAPAAPPAPRASGGSGRWDDVIAGLPYRGPSTPLAAERARQTRISVIGAVTERWAPEQAGPVYENWQLAPPIGPATDLWALGALLFRVVQGHAPYPEDNAAELVQMVCAEPPAFAEECGPLRPVVESLLRQDPTERPDFEELRGWLRSLVRSAPEPDAGTKVVPLPSPPDAARLPIVRRRGELVRKRKGGSQHGRHRHKQGKGGEQPAKGARPPRAPRVQREPRIAARQPRSLGKWLIVLIMAGLAAAVVYAVVFLPKGEGESPGGQNTGSGQQAPSGQQPDGAQQPAPEPSDDAKGDGGQGDGEADDAPSASAPPPAQQNPASDLPPGYRIVEAKDGFQIAVDKNWRRSPMNDRGQVRFQGGDLELVVVPGRDTVKDKGGDPMVYQLTEEPELAQVRDSTWASSSDLRRISVGQQAMAEGQFAWPDGSGRDVFVRNRAMIIDGKYHIVQVIGPKTQRDEVSRVYEAAVQHYRAAK
ncbi:protein kinase [Streptomyces sp. NPDC058657]|uniref:protein kinase n=1 Tax=unclassified Streptomyces TaxID=2593676 RepID=UPI00365DC5BA